MASFPIAAHSGTGSSPPESSASPDSDTENCLWTSATAPSTSTFPNESVVRASGVTGITDTPSDRTLCLSVSVGTQRSVNECLLTSPSKPSASW